MELSNESSYPNLDETLIQHAYVEYLGGIAMLNQPDSDFSHGIMGDPADNEDYQHELVVVAGEMIYNGLRDCILHAQPILKRTMMDGVKTYTVSVPKIVYAVDRLSTEQPQRLDDLNPAFRHIRPLPLTDPKTYEKLCSARRDRLRYEALIHPIQYSLSLDIIVSGRTLQDNKDRIQAQGHDSEPDTDNTATRHNAG